MSNEVREQVLQSNVIQHLPRLSEIESDVDSEFIDKLVQKTEEGKISWTRKMEGHSGRSADGLLHIELVDQASPIFGKTWRSFVVSQAGTQILSLNNEANGLMVLAGVAQSAAHRKVSALRSYLETARIRQVRSALANLEKL